MKETGQDQRFDTLESRIQDLEQKLYGSGRKDGEPVIPKLTEMSNEVGNALSSRERIAPLMRRLKELESYLDPSFSESKGIPAELKADLILTRQQQILEANKLKSSIPQKAKVLDKNLVQDLPEKALISLSKVHIDQEERAEKLGHETLNLIAQYNDIMATISETFVRYDEVISAAEEVKKASQKDQATL